MKLIINKKPIRYFEDTRMFDATEMWRANGSNVSKRPQGFLSQFQDKIRAWSKSENLSIDNFYKTILGRNGKTLMRYDLALAYGEWLSPEIHGKILETFAQTLDIELTSNQDTTKHNYAVVETENIRVNEQTMSSVTIANLLGKRHDNVLRKLRELDSKGILSIAPFEECEKYANNRERIVYHLPKRETLILNSSFNATQRAIIIDYWLGIENQSAQGKVEKVETVEEIQENNSTENVQPVDDFSHVNAKLDIINKTLDTFDRIGGATEDDKAQIENTVRFLMRELLAEEPFQYKMKQDEVKPIKQDFDMFDAPETETETEPENETAKPTGDFWSVGERIVKLGFKYDLKDAMKIGQSVVQSYRKRHSQKPKYYMKYINGQFRKVKYYGKDDLDILDNTIKQYFSQPSFSF